MHTARLPLLAFFPCPVRGLPASLELLAAPRALPRSAGGPAAVGRSCSGGGWLFSDGCPRERVTDLEGQVVEVALSCFRVGVRKPDELVGMGEEGKCFIPKGSQCDEDAQCRNGTSCMLDGGGGAYTCQEVAADHTFDGASAAEAAAHVAAIIRHMAESLSNSELLSGDQEAAEFMDTRSGAMSPYAVRPALAKRVLAEVSGSFASAAVRGQDAASRSGALFVASGDGRFLAKSVREPEYEEFADRLIGPLARHAGLASAACRPASDSCWAEAALSRTSLNIPVLAFVHHGRYWVVMPASAPLRGLAASRSAGELQPWGAAEDYDVKPLWAKSSARPNLTRKLAELGMNPTAPAASDEMRAQWASLKATVEGDIDFLSRAGSDDAPLIDYSLLFEVYTPGRRVDIGNSHCLEGPPCFGEDPAACHVVCVSIIDFFTRFTFNRLLESWWKRFKFHDYAQKAKDLLECPFSQRFPSPDSEKGTMLITPLDKDPSLSGIVEVVAYVTLHGFHEESVCNPYADMACEHVVTQVIFMQDDCAKWYQVRAQNCFRAICRFRTDARYLDACGSWMQERCLRKLHEYNIEP